MNLKGLGVAMVTPFNQDDVSALKGTALGLAMEIPKLVKGASKSAD